MTPERWQQVKAIFNSAIGYRPEERSLFISRACSGDDNLRHEVESLIASHEESGSFIDQPAFEAAASLLTREKNELTPGQMIASYAVVSFISRGGMGEVYLAEDKQTRSQSRSETPAASFHRLTTIDCDASNRKLARLPALNHPNIITIYEIDRRLPSHIIATEFVDGETLRSRFESIRPFVIGKRSTSRSRLLTHFLPHTKPASFTATSSLKTSCCGLTAT